MPTLNIEGRKVTVDDSFLKLSPADQQSTVDEIAASFAPSEPVTTNSIVRSLGTGVPIVGGLLNKADAATNAALAPVLNPLFDEKDQLSEPTFAGRYAHSLRDQEGADQQFETQHPITDTAAKITGSIAGMIPAMATAPAAFGLTGGVGRMMLQGGIANALLGGTDAAVRGDNPIPAATLGGALGVAGPVAGAVVRGVAAPIVSNIWAMANPTGYATRQVARAISESGLSTDEIANRIMAANADGQGAYMVADAIGNPGQRMLSSVARAPGEGRTAVVDAIEGRQATQGRRVANALSEGFGSTMTPEALRDAMTTELEAIADEAYGAVRNDANPVDVQGVIDHIDANVPTEPAAPDTISGRLQRYRRMLTNGDEENPQNLSDFAQVQRVRSELSDEVQNARQSGQGNRARMLGQVLNRLDASLEGASQGFRQANQDFAQASRNIDAIDAGRNAAMRGRTEDTIPAFRALQPRAQQAFRTGYVDPLIADVQKAAPGVNKARPLLNDAFADEAGAMAPGNAQLQRRLARENTMFQTRNAALGNSKTVENIADDAALGIDPSFVAHVFHGNYVAAARHLIQSGSNILNGNTAAVRARLADILMRHGADVTPASLDAMVGRTLRQVQKIQRIASTSRGTAQAVAAITPETTQPKRRLAKRN